MTPENIFSGPPGSTPLDEEGKEGLRSRAITTKSELDEAEQASILMATIWVDHSRIQEKQLLSTKRLKLLHRRMFSQVWKWAGQLRQSDTNIGVPWWDVSVRLDSLCNDTLAQIADTSSSRWTNDEIAIRFHHRLVQIHPFVNGNGRHARLVTNKLVNILGEEDFTWGSSSIDQEGIVRSNYIQALRNADNHDFTPLLRFARS
ncbi:MAG: mobile mystery protein B [Actinomycetota bacterium]